VSGGDEAGSERNRDEDLQDLSLTWGDRKSSGVGVKTTWGVGSCKTYRKTSLLVPLDLKRVGGKGGVLEYMGPASLTKGTEGVLKKGKNANEPTVV